MASESGSAIVPAELRIRIKERVINAVSDPVQSFRPLIQIHCKYFYQKKNFVR
jgi:hypothetical protein